MEKNIDKIFVYGSLRSGFQQPAYEYISRYFKLIGMAKVKGHLYDMGNYAVAKSAVKDGFIIGELYEINNEDEFSWAIEQLDDYEGVNPEENELPLYERKMVTVYHNDEETPAWIYWYKGETAGHPIIASGDVLQFMQQKSKF